MKPGDIVCFAEHDPYTEDSGTYKVKLLRVTDLIPGSDFGEAGEEYWIEGHILRRAWWSDDTGPFVIDEDDVWTEKTYGVWTSDLCESREIEYA